MISPEGPLKKKQKMSTGHSEMAVPARTKNESPASKFKKLVPQRYFVDKTLLISSLFAPGDKPMMMMTGPRRFGKTVNLASITDFVELEVDQDGKPLTKNNLGEDETTVDDTPNYQFFSGSKLKIMEKQHCVHAHFGKYPIIQLNFLQGSDIGNYDDALSALRVAIHRAYLKHEYLYKSPLSKLKDDQKDYCKDWCHKRNYKNFDKTDVSMALEELSRYLYKQFGRTVFVAVDEFGSIISRAIDKDMEKKTLASIAKISIGVLANLVKDNPFVGGVFVTLAVDFSDRITGQLTDLQRFKFAETSELSNYYGFIREEVTVLLQRYEMKESEAEQIHAICNGYHSTDGVRLYNPYAVVMTLKSEKLQTYWVDSTYINAVKNALQLEQVKHKLLEMLFKGKKLLECDILEKFSLGHIVDLQNLANDPNFNAGKDAYNEQKLNLIFNYVTTGLFHILH